MLLRLSKPAPKLRSFSNIEPYRNHGFSLFDGFGFSVNCVCHSAATWITLAADVIRGDQSWNRWWRWFCCWSKNQTVQNQNLGFFPKNRTKTDRPRPLWNRNNTKYGKLVFICRFYVNRLCINLLHFFCHVVVILVINVLPQSVIFSWFHAVCSHFCFSGLLSHYWLFFFCVEVHSYLSLFVIFFKTACGLHYYMCNISN